jgi:hypothetical protein
MHAAVFRSDYIFNDWWTDIKRDGIGTDNRMRCRIVDIHEHGWTFTGG